jgi:integrase
MLSLVTQGGSTSHRRTAYPRNRPLFSFLQPIRGNSPRKSILCEWQRQRRSQLRHCRSLNSEELCYVPRLDGPEIDDSRKASAEISSRRPTRLLAADIKIGYHTAMRSGETRDIKWSQVDFLNNVIREADQTKGNTARQIPIFGELKKMLLAQQARRQPDCPYVCFRINRTGHAVPIGDFRKVWQDRCVKLGLGKWAQAIDSNGQPKF